jgi:hypothetical protein
LVSATTFRINGDAFANAERGMMMSEWIGLDVT